MDLRVILCCIFIALASVQAVDKPIDQKIESFVEEQKKEDNGTQAEEVLPITTSQVESTGEINQFEDNEDDKVESIESDESNIGEEETTDSSDELFENPAKKNDKPPKKENAISKADMKLKSNTSKNNNVTEGETIRLQEVKSNYMRNKTENSKTEKQQTEKKSDKITKVKLEEVESKKEPTVISKPEYINKQGNEQAQNKSTDQNFTQKMLPEKVTKQNLELLKTTKDQKPEDKAENLTLSVQKPSNMTKLQGSKQENKKAQQNSRNGTTIEQKPKDKKPESTERNSELPETIQEKKPEQKLTENLTLSVEKPLNMTQQDENKQEKKKAQHNPKNSTKIEQTPKNKKPLQRPHILFIMADDLGWNDVSFHGSNQIMTPNIDILAYTGVVLPQYYTDVQGSASRSALFTGKLPVRLGTQGDSIKASEDRGIPVSELLLPSYLRDLGYATHLVGKWDVGKSREHYLPTSRGFDTFYGFLGSAVDYYTYNLIEEANGTSFYGLDFFDGTTPVDNQQGHLTEVLTDRAVQIIRDHKPEIPLYLHLSHAAPHAGGGLVNLQVPEADIQANDHIAHSARRLYAGLVTNMDKSIGNVIAALAERDMLEDTLIVFVSDNGAPTTGDTANYGSNLPLRGSKNTPWEGGSRSTAVLWHKSLKSRNCNSLFHVTDWLPTLVRAAGGNTTVKVDGIDQWDVIAEPEIPPKRMDVLVTINEDWAALREGDFKIIVGNIDRDRSGYQSAQLQAFRHKPLPYETVLLKSETYMVFKETLELVLDVDKALSKRKESTLIVQTTVNKNDSEACTPAKDKGCLYNITADPTEAKDLWNVHPDIVRRLTLRLRTFWSELKARTTKRDPRANPALHKYIWVPWVTNDEVKMEPNLTTPPFPLQVSMGELQYLVDLNMNMFRDKIYESVKSMGDSFLKSVGGLFNF